MQNNVLFNKVMNKTIIITVEMVDQNTFTYKKASMGPVALKTMLPPFFILVEIVDADGSVFAYEIAKDIYFNMEGSDVLFYTDDLTIDGNFETDSWSIPM